MAQIRISYDGNKSRELFHPIWLYTAFHGTKITSPMAAFLEVMVNISSSIHQNQKGN